jgi:DNA polymerase-3 subunit delta'
MSFNDIAGQPRVKAVLRRALAHGRVPHALLFAGPPGVGQRRMAIVLAQALNCLERRDDACGTCASCRAIEEKRHPDVLEIVLQKKKSSDEMKEELSIEQYRDLKQLAYLRPLQARQRVFLWNADLMSDDAWHSILKVLEEPPATTTLILTSENPELVLPTVRSRCQTLTFRPVAVEEIEAVLRGRGHEAELARVIALVVRGNIERAAELDWAKVEKERAKAWIEFSGLVRGDAVSAFLRHFAFGRRKDVKEAIAAALELFGAFARDLVLLQEGGADRLLFNPDYQTHLRELAGGVDPGRAKRLQAAVERASVDFDRYNLHAGLLATAIASRMIG